MRATIAVLLLGLPASAFAQNFPPESAWIPMRCGAGVMTDLYRDTTGAIDERDVVGDGGQAAGLRYADAQFVYLRLRVDGDPQSGANWRGAAWGFEFNTDGDLSTYEILVSVNGVSNQVAVFRNSATTVANSPADPADTPAVATFPIATHARSVLAGSAFGGNGDFFVDIAVPWATLQSIGWGQQTQVRVWAGTSSIANALDADIACNDGGGGPPSLSGSASDPTGFGPGGGTGGSGGAIGPVGENGLEFEGGPSCSCDVGRSAPAPLWAVLLLLVIRRGRRSVSKK